MIKTLLIITIENQRRGRATALNMVITETGAASAVSQILSNLEEEDLAPMQ